MWDIYAKKKLWKCLNKSNTKIPRDIFAELIDGAEFDELNMKLFLDSLEKLQPYERSFLTGLRVSLNQYMERLPINVKESHLAQFIEGIYTFLDKEPYIDRTHCYVSKEYSWLLNPVIHLIERLVRAKKQIALSNTVLSILLMVPALRNWGEMGTNEFKDNLHNLIPDWTELNDALYWASVKQAREFKFNNAGESLVHDGTVAWVGHFWKFEEKSLPRVLGFINSRELHDDRRVALSTAFRIYIQSDRPGYILIGIRETVKEDEVLQEQLENMLNPPVSESERKYEEKRLQNTKKREEEERRNLEIRDNWIQELRNNPNRIREPEKLEPGDFSWDQYWLLMEVLGKGGSSSRADGANWHILIPEFGEEVANAYKEAAKKHWRFYSPSLQSEGVTRENSTPYTLIFAMVGLEIEFTESESFPTNLTEEEVNHALRYITWELNGFPSWLEKMFKTFPQLVIGAIEKELLWELQNSSSNHSMSYILHDLVYYTPWLHESITPIILAWIKANPGSLTEKRYYFVQILMNGGVASGLLADIASSEIERGTDIKIIAWWYGLLVDCMPERGIPEFSSWLSRLKEDHAKKAALIFVTVLLGGNHLRTERPILGNFKKVEHLKALYILMHQYIKAKEDTNRGTGVYTPELRDDAQHARSRLLDLLAKIPGKESYIALKQLVNEHPNPSYRPWMAKRAQKKAELDGELELWSSEQVSTFARSQVIIPQTHRQLFDLSLNRLLDLKKWLEQGNDSPWKVWQKAEQETDMRTLVTGWLNQQAKDKYTTAMEPELANSQRMDIWMHNTHVTSPVPIEIKLLDKGWSGPKLCERLRNQLVGDYLREEGAQFGIMLLVGQNIPEGKKWVIEKKRVELVELRGALKRYWNRISKDYPAMLGIDVIVIDLAVRGKVSNE